MNMDKWPHWLQVGANLGLLVGLVFVAIQLYQDRQLKTAELIAGSLQEHHARHLALMGDNPATALSKLSTDQALNERDQFIAKAYFDSHMVIWSRNSILEQIGLLPPAWSNRLRLADSLWANQYGIRAVEKYLQDSMTPSDGLRTKLADELERIRIAYTESISTNSND